MAKVALFLLVLAAFYLIWKAARRRASSRAHEVRRQEGERMVACRYCGVFLPRSDACVAAGGLYFCCDEHRQLFCR